ncbi:MAG: sulfatase, partial [Alcanivoracaceae bacterium]|nr:sulfatase [Alcanivoracaceae bacterium]
MKKITITGYPARFFIVLLLIILSSACQQKPSINVLIITFDTTRADHIAAYGNDKAHTPTLDQLAIDGVLYEKALTSIPITLPSHSSIMTGKVPFVHGVRDNGLFKLAEKQETLAEILKENGYKTAAAIGSFPLSSQFGINQGFDYFNEHITQKYEDLFGQRTIPKDRLFFDERKAAQVNDAIMPWIENNAQSPFFAWIHYFDPHHPHEPPAPYNQSFIHDLYLGEIAYADESLGNIIAQLKRLDVYDNTLIVFTSDHGEGLGEHNESTHSLLIYNGTLHVPLIIKYPQQQYANTKISNWVGLVDIFPSILNKLGIVVPDGTQGQILPITDSIDTNHEIYAETLSPRFSRGWGEQRGLVKNGYKYIYGPQKELYNINNDPKEVHNLIKEKPLLANSMKSDLQNYIDEYQDSESHSSIDIDADTLNILRGLGYVQSSAGAVEYFEEKLDDTGEAPQLHVDTISTYSHAKNLLFAGNYIEANRYLDALLL